MVRHAVPINTLKSGPLHAHHAAAAAAAAANTLAPPSQSFGEHRRISSIPGSKTAAAFLSSLSANLTLPDADSPFPSPVSTPPSMRGSADFSASHTLPPPSPLASAVPMSAYSADDNSMDMLSPASAATATSASTPGSASTSANRGAASDPVNPNPLAGVPELVTGPATEDEDKIAALKLVADSIAQQRQAASWAIISNPAVLAGYVLLLAILSHYLWHDVSDLPLLFTTGAGVTMACLVAVRLATARYIHLAEALNWSFLDEDVDTVLITKFGERVIGALVLGWAAPAKDSGNRAQRRSRKGRGVIKAWTVLLKYRGKGIGSDLLEEAVRITAAKGGEGIEFAEEHANSARFLPTYFNKSFDQRDAHAHAALESIVQNTAAFGGKRKRSNTNS